MRGPASLFPREHGGWVMLYAPLVAGVIRGGNLRWDVIAVAAAVTAAYFARLPALAIINRGTRSGAATRWLAVCGIVVGLSALWLLWHPRRSALAVIALAGAARSERPRANWRGSGGWLFPRRWGCAICCR